MSLQVEHLEEELRASDAGEMSSYLLLSCVHLVFTVTDLK